MFRRVVLQDWHTTLAGIGFVLVGFVFVAALVRAFVMRKDAAEHSAHLPLEDQLPPASEPRHE